MDAVDELCNLLGIGVDEGEGLSLALDDPETYIEDFAERLEDRGVDEPSSRLGTIAFADALVSCDLALVLESGMDAEDIADAMTAVLGEVAEEFDADELDTDDLDDVIDAIQTFVEDEAKLLYRIDIDSEHTELFVVDEEDAERLDELLEELELSAGPY